MEANSHAFQATPHKCDRPTHGHYSNCDRGGCSQSTRDREGSYGPGEDFTIDTRHPFEVGTEFVQDSGKVLTGMRTTLHQGSRQVVMHHSSCSVDYLAQLSAVMTSGMSLRITYWGDKAETMSWMDIPPCGRQACAGASAGRAMIRNITIASLPHESQSENEEFVKQAMLINGLSEAVLAGEGGSIEGGQLTIKHGAGFSLFSDFHERWDPKRIAQIKLLGKAISFTVDLSHVGCACNLALYLISAPARDWNGKLNAGSNRGGQPPYYCDANEVGGQWCPEVDIMEANSHAFQATPHKCDAAVNGHYNSCDRGGCSENTRDQPDAYGPGSAFTIDTRHPFEVRTEFPVASDVLTGMRTILHQFGREVMLKHSSCESDYFDQLSDAMAAGMSLRITYWGDRADTMSWMDSPPCGRQACAGANAGQALIRNVSITTLPAPASHPRSDADVWVVSDPTDKLFKQVVPTRITEDATLFVSKGNRGIADWKGDQHFAKRVKWEEGTSLNSLMRRYERRQFHDAPSRAQFLSIAVVVMVSVVALLVVLGRRRLRHSTFQRVPVDSSLLTRSESGLEYRLATLEAAVEDISDCDHVE